jgi:ABC-type transporter Mla subunit MlaD
LTVFDKLRARVVGNPVTGEAYLLLDMAANPPPPPKLSFTPSRPYVPSMPSPLAIAADRLPAVLERAEETLRTLREIVARVPDSLDRSDRFFTNVEKILRDSQLAELSADLRKFSTTTTGQFADITANLERLVGTEGSLVKFAEEARKAIREADVVNSQQAGREAADRTMLAADDLRRTLPAIRDALEQIRDLARRLEEQPESVVYGPRKAKGKS